jgi:hypothetical protein
MFGKKDNRRDDACRRLLEDIGRAHGYMVVIIAEARRLDSLSRPPSCSVPTTGGAGTAASPGVRSTRRETKSRTPTIEAPGSPRPGASSCPVAGLPYVAVSGLVPTTSGSGRVHPS